MVKYPNRRRNNDQLPHAAERARATDQAGRSGSHSLPYRFGNGRIEFCVTIRMIGLAANPGPFFIRINPNAAEFTPHFNKICDWNAGLFCLHQYLPLLATEMKRVSQ